MVVPVRLAIVQNHPWAERRLRGTGHHDDGTEFAEGAVFEDQSPILTGPLGATDVQPIPGPWRESFDSAVFDDERSGHVEAPCRRFVDENGSRLENDARWALDDVLLREFDRPADAERVALEKRRGEFRLSCDDWHGYETFIGW